jgi:hypothetical protein
VRQFNALLAAVLDVREADHVRAAGPFRIMALELAARMHARDLQGCNALSDVRIDLPPQVDKAAVFGSQPPFEFRRRHLEQAGKLADLRITGVDVFGNRPDRSRGHGRGEHDAVAVGDPAAGGRDVERARITRLALPLQKLGRRAPHQVKRAPGERDETAEEQEQHQLRTPSRQCDGQQRIRVEADPLAALTRRARARRSGPR